MMSRLVAFAVLRLSVPGGKNRAQEVGVTYLGDLWSWNLDIWCFLFQTEGQDTCV